MDSGQNQEKSLNPRQNANPFSVVTFFYTLPTFLKGFKKDLDLHDLPQTLNEHKSCRLGDKFEVAWKLEEECARKLNKRPSLTRTIVRTFGGQLMLFGIVLAFVEIVVKLMQPICLGQLISYYSSEGEIEKITKNQAYLYAGGVIFSSLLTVLFHHPYLMATFHVGMKIRVACCSLIYRKALRLSKTALGETTPGQIVNLLSNDVNRFDFVTVCFHYLWVGPIQTIIAMYLMYQEVGISAVIGVTILLLFIPLQFILGKMSSIYRLKTAIRTDERVRLMNEIINGIQVIKMYTWEKPFANLVSLSRRYEINSVRAASFIKGVYSSFVMFTTRTSLFVTILAYVLLGNTINAKKVFVLTAFYNILRHPMTVYFPMGIAMLAETLVSIRRFRDFLLYEEVDLSTEKIPSNEKYKKINHQDSFSSLTNMNALKIQNGLAKWSETTETLTNLNISIKRGSVVAIIGPVGSGKSSLLHVALQELPLVQGTIEVNGEISYASQEAWLFTGSVRQNILFGKKMDKLRYKTVVKTCALEMDFKLLPYGDKTIVGERGVSLSGGQRARINLARTVYKEADLYLLDDPLSAVDSHVGKELFQNCIKDFLHGKTVVLITHQLQYLQDVDYIFILEDGILKAEGTYVELQNSGLDFAKLLQNKTEVDEEGRILKRAKSLRRRESVASVNSFDDAPQEMEEQRSKGSISGFVYSAYIKAAGNFCSIFFLVVLFIITQVIGSLADYFISFWANLEQKRVEDDLFITNNVYSTSLFTVETAIYVYTGLTIAIILFALTRSCTFFVLCMRASIRLHDSMFNSIIHATIRFFNTNSSGRILNRFSKDIGSIDERLPGILVECCQIGLALMGIIIVVAIINPYLLIPTLLIGVIFYYLRVFYLRTSRNIKRLEGVTRSPVFGHLNATLQGMTTIRAYGAQTILQGEFDNHQDLHSSAWFTFVASSTAFGYWLDVICVVYITIVTLSFFMFGNGLYFVYLDRFPLPFPKLFISKRLLKKIDATFFPLDHYGGNVGLAITQSLALTGTLQWGLRQSTELENHMTSVERILEYTSVEQEPPLESSKGKKPEKSWPNKGEIKFINLFLNYFPNDPPVLKNLNFTIRPLEKVGIVGRTGAGKSSLIAALFRLTDTKGSILIDDLDIKDIGLHDLRSRISIIPQEPVIFSGTMRKNLDPFDEFDDEVLWKALGEVELKEVVDEMPLGLHSKMSEGGTNFSVGQRQLVCLARAIIRKNKILILDEATANVDPRTDGLIQRTIRDKFANCTVLTIAHRLNTVMDSDRVLVMDSGAMVEFDHPYILLENKNSYLYKMVEQTGKNTAETLIKIAQENYNQAI